MNKKISYIFAGFAALLLIALIVFGFIPQMKQESLPEANPGARVDQSGNVYVEIFPPDLEIPRKASRIGLTFAQTMDHASVEQALLITEGVQYLSFWDGEKLVVQLTAGLRELEHLTIELTEPVKASDGRQFPAASWIFSFGVPTALPSATVNPSTRFDSSGEPYISYVVPEGPYVPRRTTLVEIVFAYPMNHTSVENALNISEGLTYYTVWNRNSFTIRISNGFQDTDEFTIGLDSPILSEDGREFPPTFWTFTFVDPTITPTRTTMPTSTPRPTQKPRPTATATATPEELSYTPIDPQFQVQPFHNYSHVTTTPIAAPASNSNEFRLAQISIEDFIDLIQKMDDYAYLNDLFAPGEHRVSYPTYQYPMKFAILDALYTYPQSEFSQELQWKAALTNVTYDLYESDDWIIQTIEDDLNQGIFQPSELNSYLNQFGFSATTYQSDSSPYSIYNLFGDGATQIIYAINSTHSYLGSTGDGLLVTLRGDRPGEFDLVKLYSRWDFEAGSWTNFGCQDHFFDVNENGIPEFCVNFYRGFSGAFPTDLYLLEWHGDHFVNFAGSIPTTGWSYNDYVFNPAEYPGVEILVEHWEMFHFLHGYSFDGEGFSMVFADPGMDLVDQLIDDGNYSQAVKELETLLAESHPEGNLKVGAYTSSEISFSFASSLVFAFNNQAAEAKQILNDLISTIDQTEYPTMYQAVVDFNQIYYDAADIYSACQSALEILNPEFQAALMDDWRIEKPVIDYCSSSAPITSAINLIHPGAATPLPTILSNSGIDVLQSQQIDVFNDGNPDWVITINNLDSGYIGTESYSSFLAVQLNGQWNVEEVPAGWLSEPRLVVSNVNLPGLTYPAVVISNGQIVNILAVHNIENEISFETLISTNASDFDIFHLESTYLSTRIFRDYSEAYIVSSAEFLWDKTTKSFIEADLVSEMLFNQQITPEIIQILNMILQDLNEYYQIGNLADEEYENWNYFDARARFLYAIGLAYELTRDEANAVQTYWRVWTEYPESPYALMARAKLEPLSP